MSEEDKSGTDREALSEDVKKIIQSESDKIRTKYSQELKEVTLERDLYKSKAEKGEADIFGNVQTELAAVRAQGDLNKRVAAMLDRAVNENLDPKLAVAFAQTADPDATFDRAVEIIEKAVNERLNKKLSESMPAPRTGDPPGVFDVSWEQITKMSDDERRRLPKAAIMRAYEKAVKK